jgi:hypothetical protein
MNVDRAQLQALAQRDWQLEDFLNGIGPKPEKKIDTDNLEQLQKNESITGEIKNNDAESTKTSNN